MALSSSKSSSSLQSGAFFSQLASALVSSAFISFAFRTTTACSGANIETVPQLSMMRFATEGMLISVAYTTCLANGSLMLSPRASDRNLSMCLSLENWSLPIRATIIDYLKSTISKRFFPLGVTTSTISPFFLPMKAEPMGLLKLILPFIGSTPSGLTS